jgi:hypothetical protein
MKSVCTETRTSAQELALAKPLGRGKKLFAKSPGLGVAKKVLLVGIDAADSKPKRAVNLFGSNSSTSDDESASPRRPRKRAWGSGIAKQIPEPILSGVFLKVYNNKFILYLPRCRGTEGLEKATRGG